MIIKSRIPSFRQILAVYGLIALIVFDWTLIRFYWKLPSWMFFLNLGEIATIFVYSMATNLIESLIVLCLPMLLTIILPKRWFGDLFVSMSSALAIAGLGYTMYVAFKIGGLWTYPSALVRSFPIAAILIVVFVFLAGRIPILRKALEILADRASIFSYIFFSIGAISLMVVIIRNIL
jgi:hypothetical protein